jgi:curved DNA-binding protein CbpA
MSKVSLLKFAIGLFICINLTVCLDGFEDLIENPYRVFRLPPWSSREEIKKKYNELVRKYHPDKNKKEGSKEKFLLIQKSYEKLKKIRKIDGDEFDESEDAFIIMINDAVQSVILCILVYLMMQYGFWFMYRMVDYSAKFILFQFISMILVDKLLPHYFRTNETQYSFSVCLGAFAYFSPTIFKKIVNIFSKEPIQPDNGNKNNNTDKKIR